MRLLWSLVTPTSLQEMKLKPRSISRPTLPRSSRNTSRRATSVVSLNPYEATYNGFSVSSFGPLRTGNLPGTGRPQHHRETSGGALQLARQPQPADSGCAANRPVPNSKSRCLRVTPGLRATRLRWQRSPVAPPIRQCGRRRTAVLSVERAPGLRTHRATAVSVVRNRSHAGRNGLVRQPDSTAPPASQALREARSAVGSFLHGAVPSQGTPRPPRPPFRDRR